MFQGKRRAQVFSKAALGAGCALLVVGGLAAYSATAAPGGSLSTSSPNPTPEAIEFFEKKVRPVLAEQCFGCHSEQKPQGGLNLRTRAALLQGGALGPALVPGDPEKSLLIRAVRYHDHLKMPPKGKLPETQIRDLEAWVKMGAVWPSERMKDEGGRKNSAGPVHPQKAEVHWSFRPVGMPGVPPVKNRWWVKNPVDAFVLAELEKKGLKPNSYADRPTLIRRVTFDLTGLPPTPEEIAAFVNDRSPDAWEKVVDRLLASPQYGERWGRHWLDVVRYADSNGMDENEVFPHAWRYRDYVIRAFNEDKPYNLFLKEQLAGDLMPAASVEQRYERLTATGMLVMGPKVLAERDKPKLTMDVVDEQIDTVSKAFMGLTVSCARCHDHKFDPIATKEYYALAGIFKSTTTLFGDRGNVNVSGWMERPLAEPEVVVARKKFDGEVKKLQDRIKKCKEAEEKQRLEKELEALEAQAPPAPPMAMAVQDGTVADVPVHIRGSHLTLGEVVPRGFPVVLTAGSRAELPKTSSGRLELAEWIASERHPLTARVLVNRVWQGHFGRGLVATPNDFGTRGERPTHPELLDYLASSFVAGVRGRGAGARGQVTIAPTVSPERKGVGGNGGTGAQIAAAGSDLRGSSYALRNKHYAGGSPYALRDTHYAMGWSIKALHRLILTSAAYRMSSAHTPASYQADPENRLLWRMNRRRLEAEAIRDAMLAASGDLDPTPGEAVFQKYGTVSKYDPKLFEGRKRSIYLPVVRTVGFDMFQIFDAPDAHVTAGKRDVTTVAPQALFMMNSPLVLQQAQKLAERLLAEPAAGERERVERAYLLTLGRAPSTSEAERVLQYLDSHDVREGKAPEALRREAWQSFCQTLFATADFRYVY